MDSPHFETVVNQLICQLEDNQELLNIAQRLKNQRVTRGGDIGVNRGIIGVNRALMLEQTKT